MTSFPLVPASVLHYHKEETFATAWEEGQALTLEQATAEALGDGQDSPRA